MVDILTFDGFFGAKFYILKPRWLPTAVALANKNARIAWSLLPSDSVYDVKLSAGTA